MNWERFRFVVDTIAANSGRYTFNPGRYPNKFGVAGWAALLCCGYRGPNPGPVATEFLELNQANAEVLLSDDAEWTIGELQKAAKAERFPWDFKTYRCLIGADWDDYEGYDYEGYSGPGRGDE